MQLSASNQGRVMISNAMCLSSVLIQEDVHVVSQYVEKEDSDIVELIENQGQIFSIMDELKRILADPTPQEIRQTKVQLQLKELQENLNQKEHLLIEFQQQVEQSQVEQDKEKEDMVKILSHQQNIIDNISNQIQNLPEQQSIDVKFQKSIINLNRTQNEQIVFPELQQICSIYSNFTIPQLELLSNKVNQQQLENYLTSNEFQFILGIDNIDEDIKIILFNNWTLNFELRVKKLLQMKFSFDQYHSRPLPIKLYSSDNNDNLETAWLVCLTFLFVCGNGANLNGLQLSGLEPIMMSEM